MAFAVVLSLLLLALATDWRVGAGVSWDALNGIAVVALAALGALHVETVSATRHTSPSATATISAHTQLAYLTFGAIVLHALGMLLTDRVTLEYVSLMSPLYMVAAVAAVPMLVWLMIASTPPRRRRFGSPAEFRSAHRLAAAVLLLLAGWHTLGTDHYFESAAGKIGVTILLGSCLVMPRPIARWCTRLPRCSLGTALLLLIAQLAAFVAARNL